jgi:antitoxin ParD1/3/4
MEISLSPELEKYLQSKVETGRYASASEVIREALSLLERKEEQDLASFHAELDRRIASLDRGEGIDGEKFFASLKERTKALQKKSA